MRYRAFSLPLVARATNPGVVVEQDTNRLVRQLEPKSVLVAVIDPLGDEQRLRSGSRGRIAARIWAAKERRKMKPMQLQSSIIHH
jgi:hypothetical protein